MVQSSDCSTRWIEPNWCNTSWKRAHTITVTLPGYPTHTEQKSASSPLMQYLSRNYIFQRRVFIDVLCLRFGTQMLYIFQGECHHYEIAQNVNSLFLINVGLFSICTIHHFKLSPLKLLSWEGELLSQGLIPSLSILLMQSSSGHVGQHLS